MNLFLLKADTEIPTAPPPVQNQVTSFQDTAVESVPASGISAIQLFDNLSAYPADSTAAVISRPYPVTTIRWSTDDSQGALLATLNFPDLLLAKPFISSKLANYTFLRAGVKLTARCNGNKFLYGCLMLGWTPAAHLDPASDDSVNLFTTSGGAHALLSINDAVMPEMHMPYISPDPYINLGSYASGCIGTLDVLVLAPLLSVSPIATNVVEVTIYAEFTDTRVEGPTPTVALASPSPIVHTAVSY